MSGRLRKMRRITALLEERYGDELGHSGERSPFKTLISCVLSQRTRDVNAEKAAEALLMAAERPEDVLKLGEDRLRRLIRCSGFYNQKARYIIGICEALIREFDGRVPDERQRLLSLPGVGYKTADIVLSHAFDRPAIAVDVHVATVAKSLGLVEGDAGREEVKEALEALVPPEERRLVDSAFVRLGKEYCRTRAPRCLKCFLKPLCEYPRHRDHHSVSALYIFHLSNMVESFIHNLIPRLKAIPIGLIMVIIEDEVERRARAVLPAFSDIKIEF